MHCGKTGDLIASMLDPRLGGLGPIVGLCVVILSLLFRALAEERHSYCIAAVSIVGEGGGAF